MTSSNDAATTHVTDRGIETPEPQDGWRYVASRSRDDRTGEVLWEVRELYPTDGGFGYTENAIPAAGETLDELRSDLANMLKDLERPYLDLTVDPPRLVTQRTE